MSERVCKACGGPLPTLHGNRRYCSENCRKRLWDARTRGKPCDDCGVWLSDERLVRCAACRRVKEAERHEATLKAVEELYNAGVPVREIAVRLGRRTGVGPEMTELRRAGRIGYRYNRREAEPVERSSA